MTRTYEPERRCSSTASSTGVQCKRAALQDNTVCEWHAKNPLVKAKGERTVAATRQQILDEHVPAALIRLRSIMNDPDATNADAINAAKAFLAASGVTGSQTNVQVNVELPKAPIDTLIERLGIMAANKLAALPAPVGVECEHCRGTGRVRPTPEADVIDAEVIEFPERDPKPAR